MIWYGARPHQTPKLRAIRQCREVCGPCRHRFKQGIMLVDIMSHFDRGEVSELADEHDLGSCTARCGGSNPPFPTGDRAIALWGRPARWETLGWRLGNG